MPDGTIHVLYVYNTRGPLDLYMQQVRLSRWTAPSVTIICYSTIRLYVAKPCS
jgi:hypothetical protein